MLDIVGKHSQWANTKPKLKLNSFHCCSLPSKNLLQIIADTATNAVSFSQDCDQALEWAKMVIHFQGPSQMWTTFHSGPESGPIPFHLEGLAALAWKIECSLWISIPYDAWSLLKDSAQQCVLDCIEKDVIVLLPPDALSFTLPIINKLIIYFIFIFGHHILPLFLLCHGLCGANLFISSSEI